jgi:hypothetical protein
MKKEPDCDYDKRKLTLVIVEIKDTTDTTRSTSYLGLHLEVDSDDWLRTKLYLKRD